MHRSNFALWLLLVGCSVQAAPSADLWEYWEPHDASSTRQVDHSLWQAWLDKYLVTQPNTRTAVRYRQVSAEDRALLRSYITQLARHDPLTLNRAEQFAYWVNLYNALTVQVVLDNPNEDSITDMGGGWFSRGPWDKTLASINGKDVTLNDIEHRILRPIWHDHRIHFVVNCASISCPNLSAKAFSAANNEAQLAAAEALYLSQPKGLTLDDDGKLVLSKIFQWYLVDFAESDAGLADYLLNVLAHQPQASVSAEALLIGFKQRRYTYDWGLNAAQ